jgi:hypothetical protein
MNNDVYIKNCEKCQAFVHGTMTSAFEDSMTILYECPNCKNTWNEEVGLSEQEKADEQAEQQDTCAE